MVRIGNVWAKKFQISKKYFRIFQKLLLVGTISIRPSTAKALRATEFHYSNVVRINGTGFISAIHL
jgi:hypothetical protein